MLARTKAVLVCMALAAVAVGGCKGKGTASPNCMGKCEADCPWKSGGPGTNDAYMSCLDDCEKECGVSEEE